jgi:hypothetical protein
MMIMAAVSETVRHGASHESPGVPVGAGGRRRCRDSDHDRDLRWQTRTESAGKLKNDASDHDR